MLGLLELIYHEHLRGCKEFIVLRCLKRIHCARDVSEEGALLYPINAWNPSWFIILRKGHRVVRAVGRLL